MKLRATLLAALVLASAAPFTQARTLMNATSPSSEPRSTPSRASLAQSGYDYGEALRLSYLFYAAQRSGKLPASNPIPWRGDSHVNDCVPGGYYDAGDHLKLHFPLATSLALLAWGVDEFRDAYAAAGQLSTALDAIRWGTDYLMAAHIAPNEFIGQVGDPGPDHSYWGRPEDQTGPRPCYTWDASKPASDLASAAASALAAGALAFRPTDSAYADRLIGHARQLLDMARAKEGKYSDNYASATYVYSSYGYRDDIALAAALLWRATGESSYLDLAKAERAKGDFPGGVYVNWDGVGPLSAIILECAGTAPAEATQFLDTFRSAWQSCSGQGLQKTPSGLCFPPLGGWGNLRHANNAAFAMLVLAKCTPDAGKKAAAVKFAQSQVDYALGSTGRSFVVGFGNNYPKKVHHRAASCPNRPATCDYNSAFQSPGDNPQLLAGALVGGPPGPSDAYEDVRSNYQTNEVAVDYNAGFTGALAGLLALGSGAPTTPAPPAPPADPAPAPPPANATPAPPANCSDEPPSSQYTCSQQAGWGKCGEPWMQGLCKKSCGRC